MRRRFEYQFPWACYPAVRIALLFSLGIVLSAWTSYGLIIWCGAFFLFAALWLLSERTSRTSFHTGLHSISLILYLFCIILSGGIRYSLDRSHILNERDRLSYLDLYTGEQIGLSGKVVNRFRSSSGRLTMDLRVDRFNLEGYYRDETSKIRLYGPPSSAVLDGVYEGMDVTADILLSEPEPPGNPHEFDYKKYLEREDIYYHGQLVNLNEIRTRGNRFSWHTLRNGFREKIKKHFEGDSASLAMALLTGYRQGINRNDRQIFSRSGLSHIMAVSGLHVGFLAAPFWLVIPWLWQYRFGKIVGIAVLSIILTGYAGITGFSPSVTRASVMIWLLTAGKLYQKSRDSINLMAVSALILLLLDPALLFDTGFQLSYSAVFVILLILPPARRAIPVRWRFSKAEKILMIVMVSVVVQTGLYPLLVFYFHEFSLIGPVANVLVIPALFIFIPLSLVLIPVVDVLPAEISWLYLPALILKWIWVVAETLGNRNWGWIEADITSAWIFIGWIFGVGLAATVSIPELRWKYVVGLLAVLSVCQIESIAGKLSPAPMEVVVLDVGQGDAIYIRTPNNRHLMIDTGIWSPYGNSGEQVIIPFLDARGVTALDAVIVTHPHADHIGGLPTLIENIQIDTIYYNGYDYDSDLYVRYRQLAGENQITEVVIHRGDLIEIDPSIRIFILGPAGGLSNADPNDQSIVLKLIYNTTGWIFTGDAGESQESRIIKTYGDFLDSGYLKMGHHGSRTSSGPDFVEVVSPEIAAASLALNNRFGHPHPETIRLYHQYNTRLYFTSLDGALIFESDGKNIYRKKWK